jgi:hypothetical protein
MNAEINTPVVVEEVKQKVRKVKKPKEVKVEEEKTTDAFAEIVLEATGKVLEEEKKPDLFAEIVAKANEEEVEEVVENFDAELEAQEKIIKEAQEKTEQIRLKKQLTEKGAEFLAKIADRKRRSLKNAEERMKEAMEAWEKEIAEIEGELETIEEVEEDKIMDFLADNYADEVNGFLAEIYPEPKKETKKATKKEEGAKRKTAVVTKTMKPADRWALIEEGTQFRAKQKDFIRYYKKVEEGVMECNEIGTLLQGSTIYAGNQEAANAFRLAAGIPYSISGWEFLQLYNPHTDKAKSLKKWDGDVDYLLW